MTVKELKDIVKDLDDNKEVIIYASTTYMGAIFCNIDSIYEDNATIAKDNHNYVIISGFEIS